VVRERTTAELVVNSGIGLRSLLWISVRAWLAMLALELSPKSRCEVVGVELRWSTVCAGRARGL